MNFEGMVTRLNEVIRHLHVIQCTVSQMETVVKGLEVLLTAAKLKLELMKIPTPFK